MALTACDPVYTMRGSVAGLDGGPVEVHLECPKQPQMAGKRTAVTDASGHFVFSAVGCLLAGCEARIATPARKAALKCHERSFLCAESECSEATVDF